MKNSIGGAVAGVSLGMGMPDSVFAASKAPYDLVALKGGSPEAMFDKGIEAMGGMKRFVKKGQKVLVKPNIGWDVSVERAGNTNPGLVKRIIEHCYNSGVKEVYVFDHTCDDWQQCYRHSGIEKAVKDAGGKIVSGGSQKYYKDVSISGGKTMKNAQVHELLIDSDVFINVPILKSHGSAKLTIAMKNLMGVVWDRRFWHLNGLHQCIADFCFYRKPDLNVVDAYRVMMRNGPRGVSEDDVLFKKFQVLSTDIVAADAASAKIFGAEPKDIGHIRIADEMGLGTMDLEKLSIKRIKMS